MAGRPLTDAQQERFARHLLLDQLGGEGQERLLAASAWVALPGEAAACARWCARYLAASGVGALYLEGPWAEEAAGECRELAPDAEVRAGAPPARVEVRIAAGSGRAATGRAESGQHEHERAAEAGGSPEILLAAPFTPALGARAALEALKLLAAAGTPAALPLTGP